MANNVVIGDGRSYFDTTARQDFVARAVPRVQPIRPQASNLHQLGSFGGTSTAKSDFTGRAANRSVPVTHKDNNALVSKEPTDYRTSDQVDYPEWPLEARQKRESAAYKPSSAKFEGKSTAKADYPGKQGERVQPIRHKDNKIGAEGPGEYATTNRTDMQTWEMPERFVKEKAKYKAPTAKFEGQSTAQADYPGKSGERSKPIRHADNNIGARGPGEYATTNKSDMQQWPAQQRFVKEKAKYKPSSAKFEGKSTAKADFEHREGAVRPAAVRHSDNNALKGTGPTDYRTSDQVDYPEWPLEARQKRESAAYKPSSAKFEGKSTAKADYPGKQGERVQPIRHKDNKIGAEGPGEYATTNRTDMQTWEMPERFVKEKAKYKAPTAKFEGQSTAQADYPGKSGERSKPIRHADNNIGARGPGEYSTTTGADMQQWPAQQRFVKEKAKYKPSSAKFEGKSTAKADFEHREGAVRPAAVRHSDNNALKGTGPTDYRTSDQVDFQQWPVEARQKREKAQYKAPTAKFGGETTARADFQEKQGERAKPIRYSDNKIGAEGPGEYSTTTGADMQEWPAQQRFVKEKAKYQPPTAKFEGQTTVNADFQQKQGERSKPIRHADNNIGARGPGEYSTTTGADMQQWPAQQRFVKEKAKYKPSSAKFEGKSTAKADFEHREGAVRPAAVRHSDNNALKGTGPTDYRTSDQVDFQQWPVEARQKREKAQYKAPTAKFGGETTARADFQEKQGERAKPIRYSDNKIGAEGPGEYSTTTGADMQEWPAQQRFVKEKAKYQPPTAKFEGQTTVNADFQQKQGERSKPIRHADNNIGARGPGEYSTTTGADMQQWPAQQRFVKEKAKYKPSSAKFEGKSTAKADFEHREGAVRPAAVRHSDNNALKGTGPTDYRTSDQVDFQQWPVEARQKREKAQYKAPTAKFGGETTARADFQEKQGERAKPIRYSDNKIGAEGPGEYSTTTGADMQEWPAQQRFVKEKAKYQPPTAKFEGQTTVNADFQQKQGERSKPIRHADNNIGARGPGEYSTTTGADMQQWPAQQRFVKEKAKYKPSSAKFEGKSTAKADFEHREGAVRPAAVRHSDNNALKGTGPTDYRTSDQVDFQQWPVEARQKREKAQYKAPTAKFGGETTARADFQEKQGERAKPIRYSDNKIGAEGPGEYSTTTGADMQEWPAQQRFVKEKAKYQPPTAKFEGQTTVNADFQQKQGERSKPIRHADNNIGARGPGEYSTTTGADMQQWPAQQRFVKEKAKYKPSSAKFEGKSTAKADFEHREGAVRPAAVRHSDNNALKGTGPTDYRTSDQVDFQQWPVEARQKREKAQYKAPTAKFGGETTARADFQEKQGERAKPIRYSDNKIGAEGPGEYSTTTGADMQEWPAQQRFVKEKAKYQPPTAKFEGQTTVNADFQQKQGERSKPIRHADNNIGARGPGEYSTTTGADMQQWPAQQRFVKEKAKYKPSSAKFEGKSTAKADFEHREGAVRPAAVRHSDNNALKGTGPTDYRTSDQVDFQQWPVEARQKREKAQYKAPTAKFGGETTARADFQEKQGERAKPIRYSDNKIGAEGPGEYSTTTGADMQEWPAQQRFVKEKAKYQPPTAKFEGQTTVNADFQQKQGERSKPIRHADNNIGARGPGEYSTTTGADMQQWPAQQRFVKEKAKYKPSSAKFEGKSTAKADFEHREGAVRPAAVRHSDNNALKGTGPTDYRTSDQVDFQQWPVEARQKREKAQYKAPTAKFGGETTARADFQEKQGERAKPIRYSDNKIGAEGPGEYSTTTGADMQEWPAQQRFVKEKAKYQPPTAKFEGQTTVNADFQQKQGERSKPIRHADNNIGARGPGEYSTTTGADMQQWPAQQRFVKEKAKYKPSSAKFEGKSTAKADFEHREGAVRPAAVRHSDNNALKGTGPTDYRTSDQVDFQQWPVEARQKREKAQYKAPTAKFGGETTARADFQEKQGERAKPIRYSDNKIGAEGPGEYSTTTGADMKEWEIPKRVKRKKAEYRPNSTKFDGSTETNDAFRHENPMFETKLTREAARRTAQGSE